MATGCRGLTGRDDVRFRVKTGSHGQTGKMTRLTLSGLQCRKCSTATSRDLFRLSDRPHEVRESILGNFLADHVCVPVGSSGVDTTPDAGIADFVGHLRIARPASGHPKRREGVARIDRVTLEEQLKDLAAGATVSDAGRVVA